MTDLHPRVIAFLMRSSGQSLAMRSSILSLYVDIQAAAYINRPGEFDAGARNDAFLPSVSSRRRFGTRAAGQTRPGKLFYLITNNRFALWLLAAAAKTLDSSWEAQTPVDSSQRFHRVFHCLLFLYLFHCFGLSLFKMTLVVFASVSRSSASILLSFFFFFCFFFCPSFFFLFLLVLFA